MVACPFWIRQWCHDLDWIWKSSHGRWYLVAFASDTHFVCVPRSQVCNYEICAGGSCRLGILKKYESHETNDCVISCLSFLYGLTSGSFLGDVVVDMPVILSWKARLDHMLITCFINLTTNETLGVNFCPSRPRFINQAYELWSAVTQRIPTHIAF